MTEKGNNCHSKFVDSCAHQVKTAAQLVKSRMALREKIGSDGSSDLQETEMALESFFLMGDKPLVEDIADVETARTHRLGSCLLPQAQGFVPQGANTRR